MNYRNEFSKETQDKILEFVSDHLLDVFAFQSFREELKNLFESEKSNKKFQTLEGEEFELCEMFDQFDFEGRIDMDLRFEDEEWKVKRECK